MSILKRQLGKYKRTPKDSIFKNKREIKQVFLNVVVNSRINIISSVCHIRFIHAYIHRYIHT